MCESIYRGWWNESVGENEYVISNGGGVGGYIYGCD